MYFNLVSPYSTFTWEQSFQFWEILLRGINPLKTQWWAGMASFETVQSGLPRQLSGTPSSGEVFIWFPGANHRKQEAGRSWDICLILLSAWPVLPRLLWWTQTCQTEIPYSTLAGAWWCTHTVHIIQALQVLLHSTLTKAWKAAFAQALGHIINRLWAGGTSLGLSNQ